MSMLFRRLGAATLVLAFTAAIVCAQSIAIWTDRSGTITTGGTSQQVMAANGARRAFLVQNPCTASESLWVEQGAAAAVGTSIEIPPCYIWQGFGGLSTNLAINVTATTTGHAFVAKEAQ